MITPTISLFMFMALLSAQALATEPLSAENACQRLDPSHSAFLAYIDSDDFQKKSMAEKQEAKIAEYQRLLCSKSEVVKHCLYACDKMEKVISSSTKNKWDLCRRLNEYCCPPGAGDGDGFRCTKP